MTKKGSILVASSSEDLVNNKHVVGILRDRGFHVIHYEADKVVSGEAEVQIVLKDSGLSMTYDGEALNGNLIAAAWYRRPDIFFRKALADSGKQLGLEKEYRSFQDVIWNNIPEEKWLNSPLRMSLGTRKLTQLERAQELGFKVPPTVASNRWPVIKEALPGEKIIQKVEFGALFINNRQHIFPTTPFSKNKLPDSSPLPGIWQPFLNKKREWRITLVGEKCFDAAIYTNQGAKDDWRLQQHDREKVIFKAEPFPADLKEKCFAYLKSYGLKYGAFDFIETEDGDIYFLELNTNGQYGWLEDQLGLPISEAISEELIKIATEYRSPTSTIPMKLATY